ncbi:VOC family protein [Paenibacillus chartarius]|uniref:VOC family protein n=1 Tax=Paenibacillus chartarius TaxID=747481 RepID=A0ABV6DER6_9BACL
MIPQRISLLTLGAQSVPALRAFYSKFGWSESDFSSDNYAVFRTAGVMLTIFPIEELYKDMGMDASAAAEEAFAPQPPAPAAFRGVTLAINVDRPEQVDSVMAHARDIGARVLREPSDAFWGGRTGTSPTRNSTYGKLTGTRPRYSMSAGR